MLNNSRNEPAPPQNPTTPRAGGRRSSPPPPYTSVPGPSHTMNDQADVETEGEDEDTFPWPLTGEEEARVAQKADAISPPQVTPRKPTISNGLATPSTTRKRNISFVDDVEYPELQTSGTTRRFDARLNEETPRSGASSRTLGGLSGFQTPQTTPTPSRFKDAISGQEAGLDLTSDVLNVLQQHKVRLDNDAQSSLKELLDRNSLRIQGIIKGRDISRLQIKAKDAKIAEQHLRISTLEAELEAERAMVQHLRWERQNGAGPD